LGADMSSYDIQHTGLEKMIREQFFIEFWAELEQIERSA